MQPNPVLKKLGYKDNDRVVIFHADDIGMCQPSLTAYNELVDFGLMSSASLMVPCPWFPAAADYCRSANPNRIDMGVHLTLTSEWDVYRWGSISTHDPTSGLLDEAGYLHATAEAVRSQADPANVQTEITAQVDRAVAAGVDVTHLDTHMGVVFHPKYIKDYVELGLQHQIPVFLFRGDKVSFQNMGFPPEMADEMAAYTAELEEQGFPLLDKVYLLPLGPEDVTLEQAQKALEDLSPGITYFIIHPAADTPEIRTMAPDWPSRVGHLRLFTDNQFKQNVASSGVQVIGYRILRDLMRSN